MTRSFIEWWKKASKITDYNTPDGKKPQLNQVNYVWISHLIGNNSEENNPSVTELVEWITSGEIDAIRK